MGRAWILCPALMVAVLFTGQGRATEPEPYGAEDLHDILTHIPEPMIFDLVRPLGARKGELETNVLALGPTGPDNELAWAPELEYALLDGFALEFELPFYGSTLEAYKFAAQYTLGDPAAEHFLHGLQLIAENFRDPELWELSFLYVPGYRFDRTWSALALVGIRIPLDDAHDNELLVNLTPFADVGPYTSLGLEFDFEWDLEEDAHLIVMPQLHQELGRHFMLQLGLGLETSSEHGGALGAVRAIYTF